MHLEELENLNPQGKIPDRASDFLGLSLDILTGLVKC